MNGFGLQHTVKSQIVRYIEHGFYMRYKFMSSRPRTRTSDASGPDTQADLGKTIQRLRKAYNLSLGELSEQSGVAKSIISQIERNETNPTLSTVMRLSRALDTTVD